MSDLISKKAVMEELLAIQDATYMSTCLTVDECKGKQWMIARAIDAVKDTTTVDAVEVVHGHKIIRNRPYAAQYIYVGDDGYGNLVKRTDCSGTPIEISPATLSNPIEYCSECGKRMDGIWQNFCDNCGAKMDEVSE